MIEIALFVKPGCVSCQRTLDLLRLTGLPIRTRDLFAERLSGDEVKWLAGSAGGAPAHHLDAVTGLPAQPSGPAGHRGGGADPSDGRGP